MRRRESQHFGGRIFLLLLGLAGAASIAAPAGAGAAVGDLGYGGCLTGKTEAGPIGGGGSGSCSALDAAAIGGVGSGLDFPGGISISPDGRSVYAASLFDDAVAHFRRSAATGALSFAGCWTANKAAGPAPGSGACEALPGISSTGENTGFDELLTTALSPDGRSLYAAGADDAIVRFTRNTTTGDLTYQDCITGEKESGPTPGGTGACAAIPSVNSGGANSGLDNPQTLSVSADGKTLYAGAVGDDAIARFTRNTTTGALSYEGCNSGETESAAACALTSFAQSDGKDSGFDGIQQIVQSADGKSLYVAATGDSSVLAFSRDQTDGSLTGPDCISGEKGSGPVPDGTGACELIPSFTATGDDSGVGGLTALALSPDGSSLYGAGLLDASIARFSRDRTSGDLVYRGCTSGEKESGPPPDGTSACAPIPGATSAGALSGLGFSYAVAVSHDGRSVYGLGINDSAVATFDRNTSTGALSYDGCLTGQTQVAACTETPTATSFGMNSGLYLTGPAQDTMALSPDDASLYVLARNDDAITLFDRETPPPSGPPTGPKGPAPDTTPPGLTVTGKKTQKGSKVVKLKVTSDEAASVEASGTVKVPVVKGSASAAKAKKSKLKGDSAEVAAGATETLKLKLKGRSRKLGKKAQKAGKKVKVKATVTGVDAAGNSSSANRKVKLKGK